MKFLIVGLGNIGDEYANTRHNIGFSILDALAQKENLSFKTDRLAFTSEYHFKGRNLVLIKPTTFMNLSGKAVNYWLQKEKIPFESMLVLVDDLALPFGSIRIRAKGSDGGHNGLIDISKTINSQNYTRLRFGIGNNFQPSQQVDYVLGKWNLEEKKTLNERIDIAIEAVKSCCILGVERTRNQYNKK